MFESFGSLQKMKIYVFTNPSMKHRDTEFKEYTVLINPENYTINHTVNYNAPVVQGRSGSEQQFNSITPGSMSFNFLFDGTGIIHDGNPIKNLAILGTGAVKEISEDINIFKKIVLGYNNDTHEPRYLKLVWGTLSFNCRLTSLSINYKVFKPDGKPIRAVATCAFAEHTPIDEQDATRSESPDLTHVRIVNEGDNLPLMVNTIYNDAKYYIEVARANKLVNFRKLTSGSKIFFPPIDKSIV